MIDFYVLFTFQLKKWSIRDSNDITCAGIMDIIEHCKELCDLQLDGMVQLTKDDMKTIYEKVLQTGKQVYLRVNQRVKHIIADRIAYRAPVNICCILPNE
jgi:hypothetical protein